MFKNIENLNIKFTANQENIFKTYISLFKEYNNNVNLVSNNDVKLLYEKHIYDSLAFNLFKEKYKINNNIQLMDIGTGGGFPSLPIAIYYQDMKIYALDSIQKKIKFISDTSEKLNLKNIIPICSRVEDLPIDYKNKFDIVTTRAMAELRVVLEYAIPFLKIGGYFIAYKSIKSDEEIQAAQEALKILNSKTIDKIEYSLPIDEVNKRTLIIIKKYDNVSSAYPRKNGIIKKQPL